MSILSRAFSSIFMFCATVSITFSQVHIICPEEDTTTTRASAYRLAGNVMAGKPAIMNGVPLKVYPNGAFVGLLPLVIGENRFCVKSPGAAGATDSAVFLLVRKAPLASTPADTLMIDTVMMEPSENVWLSQGDLLTVRCKGTPGCQAQFFNAIPMTELPAEAARGLQGVYEGVLKISATDTMLNRQLRYQLTSRDGKSVTALSPGKVSVIGTRGPMVAVTRSDRTYLNFGTGGDRLGGAKMGFIGTGIRLAITGRQGDLYRVQLAPNREAWVPMEQAEVLPEGSHVPFSHTGSWNVRGDQKNDIVSVPLSERLPFSSIVESSPTRIHVDIFGAVSNSNWITQALTTKEISSVSYSVPSTSVFRITIELRHKQAWGYNVAYNGNVLVITVRRQPESLKLKRLLIAVDAGHGGTNEGAIGATGAKEKDINLATALHVKHLLENEGARVILTRGGDTTLSMNDRVASAVGSGADLLISIHSNSVGDNTDPESVHGVSTYYRYPCFRPLSTALLHEVLKTGLVNFGNVGGFNFALNGPTEMPNALVELAFMSHPEDEMKLLDDAFRKELAERIVDGLEAFLDDCDE